MMDINVLNRIGEKCRQGLLTLVNKSGSMFIDFPKGACGPAAELVGRVLKEEAGYDGVYVCGVGHRRLPLNQTHAWFEVGDYIIDITHDQFEDTGLSGWVFSRGEGWYGEFDHLDSRKGFCMPGGWPCYPFEAYAAIQEALSK